MNPSCHLLAAFLLASVVLGLSSCAHQPRQHVGVNIDRRPTPPQPDSVAAPSPGTSPPHAPVMASRTLRGALVDIAADTSAARAALGRCAGKKLLPDQEGVFDGTTQVLMNVHQALAVMDFARARSLARQARQLVASLGCR